MMDFSAETDVSVIKSGRYDKFFRANIDCKHGILSPEEIRLGIIRGTVIHGDSRLLSMEPKRRNELSALTFTSPGTLY